MNPRKATRFLIRGLLASVALAVLVAVAAFLPGRVEGNYNIGGSLASSCGCDSGTIGRFDAGQWITYRPAHPPACMSGRYVKREDGAVQIYYHPLEQGKQDVLLATAYPRLFLTKFVVNGGEVHWLWKLPTYGSIRSAIRDQEITRSTVHPNSRLKRTVYGPDLKLRRHEAHRGKGMWRTVAGDEVVLLVYQARRITPDYSILPKPRKRSLSVLLGRTYTGDTRPVKVRRSFHIAGKLLETEVSRAKFDAVYEEAMLHDSPADSLHREHVDLIVVVEDTPYLVEYESGEANGADEDDDRFRITPLETGMESSDSPFGTSRDREFLRFLRKAISTTR